MSTKSVIVIYAVLRPWNLRPLSFIIHLHILLFSLQLIQVKKIFLNEFVNAV